VVDLYLPRLQATLVENASVYSRVTERVSYTRGLIYALLSGVFLSSGGLMVRFLDGANPWTVLFYRSLAFFVTVFVFMIWRYRSEFLTKRVVVKHRAFLCGTAWPRDTR